LTKIKEITSANIVYCFLHYEYNSVFCGQRDGNLEIVQPNNLGNKVISFVFAEIGHIVQMTKTTKAGEIMLACSKGLYFGEVSDVGEVRVSINPNEVYFKEQDVKSAIEFRRDHVATCFDMDFNVHIIDRKHK
jgi:hypothetical protein